MLLDLGIVSGVAMDVKQIEGFLSRQNSALFVEHLEVVCFQVLVEGFELQ